MLKPFLSDKRINTGRQREIDLLKAYSIIMMVITHCIDELFEYEGHTLSVIIDDILAQSVGVQGFVICMGLGVIYSKIDAKGQARRGVSLLITGQVLNLVRFAVPYGILYMINGDIVARAQAFLVFSGDILQFAGLFFLFIALFNRLGMKLWQIVSVSVIFNIIGSLAAGRIHTGSYVTDQLLGLFIYSDAESYFPLFSLMIFPVFGMLFGTVLQYVNDKDRFYRLLFIPTMIVTAVYYYFAIFVDQEVFTAISDYVTLCHMSLYEAVFQIGCNVFCLCIIYFIAKRLSDRAMNVVNFISKNINRYYCVHWVFVCIVDAILLSLGEGRIKSAALCYIIAAIIITLTTLVVLLYQNVLAKPMRAFLGKRLYVWYTIVIILSIAACIWAGSGVGWDPAAFPNFHNDYLK